MNEKRRRLKRCVSVVLYSAAACCWLAAAGRALADDWPQWRGPNRNGISAETGWLQTWPPTTAWTQDVGVGFSGAAISEGRVYTSGMRSGRDIVYCFDETTGALVWSNSYVCAGEIPNEGPRGTPAVSGNELYTYSHEGHLNCWNKLTGALLWSKLVNAGRNMGEGLCGSPMVHDDRVLLNAGGTGTAVDRNAPHNILWTSTGTATHTSPWLMTWNALPTMVLLGNGRLAGLNPATGAVRWEYAWNAVNCADPVLCGDKIFLSSAYGKGCALAQLGSSSTLSSVWVNMNMENHFSTSTRVGDYVYGFHGRQGRSDTSLRCLSLADGSVQWSRHDLGLGAGFVLASDGKLILLGEWGDLIIARATSSGFDAEGRASEEVVPSAGSQTWWTVPSLANGRIYCRSHEGTLVCLQVGSSTSTPPRALREVRIGSGMDDVEQRADGSIYPDSSDLELTEDVSGVQTIGLRFVNVDIPPGATIAHARVQFKVDETTSTGTSLTIRGEATGNARAFTTNRYDVTARALTAASVGWNPPAWNSVGQAGTDQRTPELAALIQAIVDRDDWRPGQALALIVSGTGKRTAESWEGDAAGAPALVLDYSTGLTGDTDCNGICDAWEVAQFADTNAANTAACEDFDHDGFSNWEEFVAGTDPTLGGASYWAADLALELPHLVVSFPTIVATGTGYTDYQRYYALQATDSPASNVWTAVPDYARIAATGAAVRFTNTTGSARAFRARVWLE